MGAGSITAAAGPSAASAPLPVPATANALSSSLTFEVESDEDLTAFIGNNSSTNDNQLEGDHIELAVFMTQAYWINYEHWPKELSAAIKRIINFHPWFMYPISQGDTVEKSINLLIGEELSILTVCDCVFNVLLKLARYAQDDRLVDIELHVRWKDNDSAALKTPEALKRIRADVLDKWCGAFSFVENEGSIPSPAYPQDKPGVGKTVTTLALCHSRPFSNQSFLYSMRNGMFRSKATLILVPNNIANQWEQEIRKCLGDSVSVIQMKGKANYAKTSLQDIVSCDFLIVSYQLIVNPAYRGAKQQSDRYLSYFYRKFDLEDFAANRENFVTSHKNGDFAFTWRHFHRIVYDELDEVLDKQSAIVNQVLHLSADFLWGLTGTPTFDCMNTIRCRRQTPIERAFYQSCIHSDLENLLMLCNHYQIGREGANLGVHAAMSIERVTQMVQKNRVSEMADLKNQISRMEDDAKELQITLNDPDTKRVANIKTKEAKIETIKVEIDETRIQLTSIQAQFNFFENFMNTYLSKEGQKIECSVCLEENVQGEIGIVPCGHSFCGECADAISAQGKCPSCREVFKVVEVMKALPPPANEPVLEYPNIEDEDTADAKNLDHYMFGSKIREVVKYIKEESIKSDDYRFLVFIQFSDLADLVSAALKTYGLSTTRVKQDAAENNTVLAEVSEPAVNLLDHKGKGKRVAEEEPDRRLNSQASKAEQTRPKTGQVSGLNLTEAPHSIILHPFVSEKEENAVASEQQGIARVLRKGQEKTVKIVRFYVEGTVEQDIHEARVKALDATQ
ncbi:SNF2 family N-terminal domain-containing protein [Chytriomyces cf. hyalinus JEL632]|nr:SNF2 family N-terminal domain-containing protein [Chytriomyces cf. hyalinus JEL632]